MKADENGFLAHNKIENGTAHQITQHIRYGLTPLPFGTFAYRRTSYMLKTLSEITSPHEKIFKFKMQFTCYEWR